MSEAALTPVDPFSTDVTSIPSFPSISTSIWRLYRCEVGILHFHSQLLSDRAVKNTRSQSQQLASQKVNSGKFKIIRFFRQIIEKFRFFSGKFKKNLISFRQFKNNFDFPCKNCSFTATSGQIFLFLFKSHHFRIYFLYMIR